MNIQTLAQQLTHTLQKWSDALISMLPNVALALLVVVVFWIGSKVTASVSDRGLKRLHTHRSARELIRAVIRILVFLAGLVIALSILKLDRALASLLAGAGIIGLALGFAFQDLAANFISGVGLSINRPFRVGEIVETNDVFGVVKHVRLRASVVETLDGRVVTIPNKQIFQEKLINHSNRGERRVDLTCGVSYAEDLERVRSTVLKSIDALPQRVRSKPLEFFYEGFGDSSINFSVRFWISYVKEPDYLLAKSDAIMCIRRVFLENDIAIPFPIRTLDFGIKGGNTLSEMLEKGE